MGRFRRVAIVNRGEAAMRFIHAAREFPEDLTTIALHTAAERKAMFVREADEAVCFDNLALSTSGSPYLDLAVLEAALVAARAEAVWVGWGFVAERAEFADLCARLGITFIGPSGEVMRSLGDKIGAKALAEDADVPMAPWSRGPVRSVEEAAAAAAEIGYPLMVKAAAGGGGRGIRRANSSDELADAFERATAEGQSAFGDPTVFLERVVTNARHVEVQIIADEHGTVWAPGVRDCSVQRRNQKVIEESHSTALSPQRDRDLRDAAIRLAKAAGYVNAGTVEFLYQPDEDLLAFLEVNTRLQVEHPVTEVTTGVDLVALQLSVAMGEPLPGDCPQPRGHAFEARLNAEDPQAGFAPAAGQIRGLGLPTGPGVRVDTGVAAGDVISPDYDSMVAKIIAWGQTREQARVRLRRALRETTVLVEGGTTNKSFLLDLVDRDEIRTGVLDTGWLDRLTAAGGHHNDTHADIALIAAAIDVHEDRRAIDIAQFLSSAARGRPEADLEVGHDIEVRMAGQPYKVHVATGDTAGWYRVSLDGVRLDVVREQIDLHRVRITVGSDHYDIVSQATATDHRVEVDGITHRLSRDDAGMVRAPAVSLVVSIDVALGDTVRAGQRIAVVEAMKMETIITAPTDGEVVDVFAGPNMQVDAGAGLVRISGTTNGNGAADDGARVSFSGLVSRYADAVVANHLDVLRSVLLGFDVTDAAAADTLAAYCASAPIEDDTVRRAELELLRVFADLCGLTRDRRLVGRDHGLETRSPREHFNAYLHAFDHESENQPPRFFRRLEDALAHYGIDSLERSPDLEAAAFRIHRAAQRRGDQVGIIQSLLHRRLDYCGPDAEREELRDTLDRLIAASQAQYPAIGNMARSVRYRCIDRPLLDAARESVEDHIDSLLARLDDDPRDEEVIAELVSTTMPLLKRVGRRDGMGGDGAAVTSLVEVLTRRYYKIRDLVDVQRLDHRYPLVTCRYLHRNRTVGVVALACDLVDLSAAVAGLADTVTAAADQADEVVVDLYLRTEPVTTAAVVSDAVERVLAVSSLPVARVTVVAATAGPGLDEAGEPTADAAVHTSTWERGPGGLRENTVFRGLHPMIDRRLNLWRLKNFDLTRLPSADDTHVFHCTATDQPADERLIAVAEVRDSTPLRAADGTLIALPEFERVLGNCLDGIRQAQAADPGRQQLEWNRIMLFVWPPVEISADELNAVAKRLVPMTGGLGLEQVVVQGRIHDPDTSETAEVVVRIAYQAGQGIQLSVTDPPTEPMAPLDDYTRKVLQCRRRGTVYPYELIQQLTGAGNTDADGEVADSLGAGGSFTELDVNDAGDLVPVDRPPGTNPCGIIVGLVDTATAKYPEGMRRVAVFGDPTKSMGSIAEAECLRLLAAIDLAERERLPVEWFALSAGARIAMDSGSENLDWVAAVLRRIVEFTQAGGEINVVVAGVNVGAQPYWNAEATMLMHTRGVLIMTPDSAMVLTGKQAIDFSGGVSADDNIGIGGYERIMGPNGQAQYWAPDLPRAVEILLRHYDHTYVVPGETGPRSARTTDPVDRDVRDAPHTGGDTSFTTVGDIFSSETNPDRKKPFDIRSVMQAVIDQDHRPLERWTEMADAEGAVVIDAHLGGHPVSVVGVESRPLPRAGLIPADGPTQWSAGTLFPLSSKKVARAINAASGNRPVVVLANLSGFDGSPESLRNLQLEYGAEIGRALVNFDGPVVLCVVSRYHGGAFVVFSGRLNDRMRVLAVDGAHASVIGGAPAAAVVFTREVDARTDADDRVQQLEAQIARTPVSERGRLRAELATRRAAVRNEKLGEVAAEFDAVHSVQRARDVGSVHEIIEARTLRPSLIAAVKA